VPELPSNLKSNSPAGEPAVYNRSDFKNLIKQFDRAMAASDLKPSAASSYVGSAERFVRWLDNDYRPRNAGAASRPLHPGPWTFPEIQKELERFREVLEEARLRPLAVQTYVHSAGVFLRWISGSYRPRDPRINDRGTVRPNDLASELNVDDLTLRNFLRARYPRTVEEKGAAWYVTADQADEVRKHFTRTSRLLTQQRSDTGAPIRSMDGHAAPEDWFWEGHVQDVVMAYLLSNGWHIDQVANTATRAQGHDIAASRGRERLVVEVKGYPSVGYRDPRRATEIKRAQPSSQAKHWFADALLKVLRLRGLSPETSVALALPDFPRYRTLLADVDAALRAMRVCAVLVSQARTVEEVIPLPSAGDRSP
jgi:hypothetical protein